MPSPPKTNNSSARRKKTSVRSRKPKNAFQAVDDKDDLFGLTNQPKEGQTAAQFQQSTVFRDSKLSEEQWYKVYQAFGVTGDTAEIARMTSVKRADVEHLLDIGIKRLELPPVREKARTHDAIATRVERLVGAAHAIEPNAPGALLQNMPDVKAAVTERVVRETAAAQAALLSGIKVADVMLGYTAKLAEGLNAGSITFDVPDKIKPSLIETLAKAASSLANAIAKGVEQSRLVAGEPTQNVVLHVASFAAQLTQEELRSYALTRQLPRRIRTKGGVDTSSVIETTATVVK